MNTNTILSKIKRVYDSCNNKKQLRIARKYCVLLTGKAESYKDCEIEAHFDLQRKISDIIDYHREVRLNTKVRLGVVQL